jgi:hypothetical protein
MPENFLTYRRYLWGKITLLVGLVAIVSYLVYSATTTPHGATVVGLIYGVIGLLAVLLLMYYGIRKRSYRTTHGTLQAWLSSHVFLGVLTLVIIPMHAGFRFGVNIHTLAFVLLALVVVSGMVGTFLYQTIPPRFSASGPEVVSADIDREFVKITQHMRTLCAGKSAALSEACEAEIQRGLPRHHLGWRLILGGAATRAQQANPIEAWQASLEHVPASERDDLQRLAVLTTQKRELEYRLAIQMRLKNLLEAWLYIHGPLSLAMLLVILLHILLVLYY